MAGKKFSDTSPVALADAKKLLSEGGTTDEFAHVTGSGIKTYLNSEGYVNESQFTADETVLIRESGGAIVDYAYSNFSKPSKMVFAGGFLKKTANTQITTEGAISCIDATGVVEMNIASGYIKEINNAWAAGSGAAVGALDTGVLAAFKMYSIYVIAKADGTSDLLCVEGGNTPTMPTDYTYKREIARIQLSTGSIIGKIFNYYQIYNNTDMSLNNLSLNYFEGFEITKYTATTLYIEDGTCQDSSNLYDIPYNNNSTKIQKIFNIAWSVGNGGGTLDTGSIADDTQYYLYVILNPTTGAIDFLMSLSATNPTMPAGFTIKKMIGFLETLDYSGSDEYIIWDINDKYEDVNIDIGSFAKDQSIITSAPEFEALFSGDSNTIKYSTFDSAAGQDHYVDGVKEYPHAAKDNASFHFHGHLYPEDDNAGNVVFFLDYIITAEGDSVATAPTRLTKTVTISALTKGKQQTFAFDWILDPTIEEGSQISFTFGRESTSGSDTYASKIAMATFGLHYLVDKKGSDMETSDL